MMGGGLDTDWLISTSRNWLKVGVGSSFGANKCTCMAEDNASYKYVIEFIVDIGHSASHG
jgi:hypothetical protein